MENAAVDIERDLACKKNYSTNSWFAVSHFESNGEKFSVLYHVMILQFPGIPAVCTSCVSVTNETTREYWQESKLFRMNRIDAPDDHFCIKTPENHVWGNLDKVNMRLYGQSIQMEAELVPVGYPILNMGTGRFDMVGLDIFQYSLPTLKTNGYLKVNGKVYEIDGNTWFDRQWEDVKTPNLTWGWMDLNLSNGTYISLWFPVENNVEKPFATILSPDGSQRVVPVEPVISAARDFWKSDVCRNDYPTKWTITIPTCNAKLDVTTEIKNQELQFNWVKPLNHYEAASTITGIYEGEAVTGRCFVELLAMRPWSKVVKKLK